MTVKSRILLISILTSFAFWIPVWLPFAAYKGVELSTAYSFIAYYSLLTVLLEYPTGVIGDAYSHKLSVIIGYLAIAAASAIFFLIPGFLGIFFGLTLFAIGTSFISGSDQAYIHSLVDDYDSFFPTTKNVSMISTLIGISLGTLLFTVHPNLPVIATSLTFILAAAVMLTLPREVKKSDAKKLNANPLATARLGIKTFFQNSTLRTALTLFALLFAFSNNLKWLYGNLLEIIHLPVASWGLLIALFYFGRFLGILLQKKFKGKKATTLLLVALANLVFVLGYIYHPIFIPILLFLIMVIIGIVETDLELEIQHATPNAVRSSILSLKSLFGRGSAALYILLAGALTSPTSISKLTLTTFALLLFGIGLQISTYLRSKEQS